MAYSLVCMATDYDSWHETNEGVSVEMVMGHMVANGANAKRAVAAILDALAGESGREVLRPDRLWGSSRGGVMGLDKLQTQEKGAKAFERLRWLFGDAWVKGAEFEATAGSPTSVMFKDDVSIQKQLLREKREEATKHQHAEEQTEGKEDRIKKKLVDLGLDGPVS